MLLSFVSISTKSWYFSPCHSVPTLAAFTKLQILEQGDVSAIDPSLYTGISSEFLHNVVGIWGCLHLESFLCSLSKTHTAYFGRLLNIDVGETTIEGPLSNLYCRLYFSQNFAQSDILPLISIVRCPFLALSASHLMCGCGCLRMVSTGILGVSMMWTIVIACVVIFVVLTLAGLAIIRRSSKRRIVALEMNDMEDDDAILDDDDDDDEDNDGEGHRRRRNTSGARAAKSVASERQWPRLWSWFTMGTPTRGQYVALDANELVYESHKQHPRGSKTLRDVLAENELQRGVVGINIPRRSAGVVVEVDGTPIGSFGSYDGHEGMGSGSACASVLSSSPASLGRGGATRTPPLVRGTAVGADNSVDFAAKKLEGYRRAVRMSLSPQHGAHDTGSSTGPSPGRLSPALSVTSMEAYHHHGGSGTGLLSSLGAGGMPSKNWRTVRAAINTGVLQGTAEPPGESAVPACAMPGGGKMKARAKRLAAVRQWDMLASVIQANMGRKTLQDVLSGPTPPYSNSSGPMGAGGPSRGGLAMGAWSRSGLSSVGSGGSTGGGEVSAPVDMTLVSRILREEMAKQDEHLYTTAPGGNIHEEQIGHGEDRGEDCSFIGDDVDDIHAWKGAKLRPASMQGSLRGREGDSCRHSSTTSSVRIGAKTGGSSSAGSSLCEEDLATLVQGDDVIDGGRQVVLRDLLAGTCGMVPTGGLGSIDDVACSTRNPAAIDYLHGASFAVDRTPQSVCVSVCSAA